MTITPTTGPTLVPGVQATIDVPADAVVFISADGGLQTTTTAANGFSAVEFALSVDGLVVPHGGIKRVIATNPALVPTPIENWSMAQTVHLSAGLHLVEVVVRGLSGGSDGIVGGDDSMVTQAELAVLILKQN
jgi:hypothetical protein